MSAENVEIVRGYFEDVGRALDTYWESPDAFAFVGADGKALNERLHPEVVYNPTWSPEEFHGHKGATGAVVEWLEILDDWRITVEHVDDAGDDLVIVTLRAHAHGKSSGVDVDQHIFSVCAIRDAQIVLIDDHLTLSEAREAAGLPD